MKEDTAIVQLVIFDDQLDASFIYYCSPVLKLICLHQELVEVCFISIYSPLVYMKVSL